MALKAKIRNCMSFLLLLSVLEIGKLRFNICCCFNIFFIHRYIFFTVLAYNRTYYGVDAQDNDRKFAQYTSDVEKFEIRVKKSKNAYHSSPPKNLYPPDDPSPTNEDYFASYDGDYVNQPSNFSALIYDNNSENPAIFPNPEMMIYDSEKSGKIFVHMYIFLYTHILEHILFKMYYNNI